MYECSYREFVVQTNSEIWVLIDTTVNTRTLFPYLLFYTLECMYITLYKQHTYLYLYKTLYSYKYGRTYSYNYSISLISLFVKLIYIS